jgi:Ca2+-binding EF-hand superfamily protein
MEQVTILSISEINSALKRLGLPSGSQNVKPMLAALDKDGSGVIETQEFVDVNTSSPWAAFANKF